MDLLRRYPTDAPEISTFFDRKPTLIVSWWCTFYALTIILLRVCGRYIRTEKMFKEDAVMLAAICLLFVRMGLAHLILVNGTNNIIITALGLTDDNISHRELGSKLVLASRILYTAYLWIVKVSVSLFLHTLTKQFWLTSTTRVQMMLHGLLAATFIATIVADLGECQPFSHYWQVTPDPGPSCRQGTAHLLTMGIADIMTDIALVIFPIPMLMRSKLPSRSKFNISILLALPLISVAFTIFRLTSILSRNSEQEYRTLLASIDMLVATVTSNGIVLSSLLQDKGYKKLKYKFTPTMRKPANLGGKTALKQRWGSDEDLMRSDHNESNWTGRGSETGVSESGIITPGFEMVRLSSVVHAPEPAKLRAIVVEQTWEVDSKEI